MSKTHTAKALAFCATPGLIIIAYSHYLRKNRLNQRRLFGAACSSGTLAATRSSPSESCCWIVPAWRACAARAVSCAANNAVLHSANLAFNSLICTSFTASCACSVSTSVCKTPTKSQTSWFAVCDWLAFDEEISLSNRVQNHIDAQISNDSGYRFIKPRILGLPECSAL